MRFFFYLIALARGEKEKMRQKKTPRACSFGLSQNFVLTYAEGVGSSEFLFDPFFSLELEPSHRGAMKKTEGDSSPYSSHIIYVNN